MIQRQLNIDQMLLIEIVPENDFNTPGRTDRPINWSVSASGVVILEPQPGGFSARVRASLPGVCTITGSTTSARGVNLLSIEPVEVTVLDAAGGVATKLVTNVGPAVSQ